MNCTKELLSFEFARECVETWQRERDERFQEMMLMATSDDVAGSPAREIERRAPPSIKGQRRKTIRQMRDVTRAMEFMSEGDCEAISDDIMDAIPKVIRNLDTDSLREVPKRRVARRIFG